MLRSNRASGVHIVCFNFLWILRNADKNEDFEKKLNHDLWNALLHTKLNGKIDMSSDRALLTL